MDSTFHGARPRSQNLGHGIPTTRCQVCSIPVKDGSSAVFCRHSQVSASSGSPTYFELHGSYLEAIGFFFKVAGGQSPMLIIHVVAKSLRNDDRRLPGAKASGV